MLQCISQHNKLDLTFNIIIIITYSPALFRFAIFVSGRRCISQIKRFHER